MQAYSEKLYDVHVKRPVTDDEFRGVEHEYAQAGLNGMYSSMECVHAILSSHYRF